MIATFKEQTEAVLGLWQNRGCAMIATFKEQTRGCAMIATEALIATFKEQTEAVLWLPPLKNKPRLCYDCHL